MCQWIEFFSPVCGHHTRIQLPDPLPCEERPGDNPPLLNNRAPRRCEQFIPEVENPVQCYVFSYDLENPCPGPDYITAHYDPDPSMQCYYPACGGLEEPFYVGGLTSPAKPKDFLAQPRFAVPRNGHTLEQLQAHMWTEIKFCQQLMFLARRYCVQRAVLEHMIHVCKSKADRTKQNRDAVAFMREDLGRLDRWIQEIYYRRSQALIGSPYLCHPNCPGAMMLDLNCRCNQIQAVPTQVPVPMQMLVPTQMPVQVQMPMWLDMGMGFPPVGPQAHEWTVMNGMLG